MSYSVIDQHGYSCVSTTLQQPGTVVNDEQEPNQNDDTDHMEFRFPGGSFNISGKNASRVFWAVGVVGIIIALGWAIANILGAWNGVSNVN